MTTKSTDIDLDKYHQDVTGPAANERPRWLDDPDNVEKVVRALYIACGLTIVADLFIHRHGHFWFENVFAFHAAFGFASYVFLIFAAKQLRKLNSRPENYYESYASNE